MAKMNKATKIALVTGEIRDCMSAAQTRAVLESRTHASRRYAARSQSAASAWARAETRCDVFVLQSNGQRARGRSEIGKKLKYASLAHPVRTASSGVQMTYRFNLLFQNVIESMMCHVRDSALKSLLRLPVVAELYPQWLKLLTLLDDNLPEGLFAWIANSKQVILSLLEKLMELLDLAEAEKQS
ncbi:hypothetical protein Baya_1368 [Bagarius yarrelli]|uniref:Uncharacterized protein n=1 Tax=Bagarius yarrelli TaxID=175774 RepID=A0A556TKW9_BAGYA|nr:hypothetical protein Baya_1368 [Bagarius yarrelli]